MNIAVAQSGGPTAAINATLAGIIMGAQKYAEVDTLFGARFGIDGIIHDDLIDISSRVKTDEDICLLCATPSSALGSCRNRLPDYETDPALYETISQVFDRHDIKAFFYIGGNDSMDTVDKLSRYFTAIDSDIRIIGVPKTIDNDLALTDHTPGFGSAAKYVITSLCEIARDTTVYDTKSVVIVEIMGRHAGWLTASTCVMRKRFDAPQLIYLPESEFDLNKFISDVRAKLEIHNAVVIAVSEGVTCSDDAYLEGGFLPGTIDAFGHKNVSGIGKFLEKSVKERIGCKVRSIELNVPQRCASHIASKTDIEESLRIGRAAFSVAMDGQTGVMAAYRRISNAPYSVDIITVPVKDVANAEKKFPMEYIVGGNDVSSDAIAYFAPLIAGEATSVFVDGLPQYMDLLTQQKLGEKY